MRLVGDESFGVGQPLKVGFSAGVTGVAKNARLDDAVAKADRLLYRAKAAGGKRILTSRQRPRVQKKQVLLADADAKAAYLVDKQLAAADLKMIWHTDGREAFEAALDLDVDLAILNAEVSTMGGLEILKRLRNTAAHAETPIILLTTDDSEEEVLRAFDLGVDDYVLKPFSARELRARACRLLKNVARRG